eukprot:s718_g31.t1
MRRPFEPPSLSTHPSGRFWSSPPPARQTEPSTLRLNSASAKSSAQAAQSTTAKAIAQSSGNICDTIEETDISGIIKDLCFWQTSKTTITELTTRITTANLVPASLLKLAETTGILSGAPNSGKSSLVAQSLNTITTSEEFQSGAVMIEGHRIFDYQPYGALYTSLFYLAALHQVMEKRGASKESVYKYILLVAKHLDSLQEFRGLILLDAEQSQVSRVCEISKDTWTSMVGDCSGRWSRPPSMAPVHAFSEDKQIVSRALELFVTGCIPGPCKAHGSLQWY